MQRTCRELLDAQLAQPLPTEDDVHLAYVGNELYGSKPKPPDQSLVAALQPQVTSKQTVSGDVETDSGPAQYFVVPVQSQDGRRGAFVFARFANAARDQVEEPVRVAAAVAIATPILCSLLIWFLVGRAMAPLRSFADAARQITEFDLDRRIRVTGGDEVAELEGPSTRCWTGSEPLSPRGRSS